MDHRPPAALLPQRAMALKSKAYFTTILMHCICCSCTLMWIICLRMSAQKPGGTGLSSFTLSVTSPSCLYQGAATKAQASECSLVKVSVLPCPGPLQMFPSHYCEIHTGHEPTCQRVRSNAATSSPSSSILSDSSSAGKESWNCLRCLNHCMPYAWAYTRPDVLVQASILVQVVLACQSV